MYIQSKKCETDVEHTNTQSKTKQNKTTTYSTKTTITSAKKWPLFSAIHIHTNDFFINFRRAIGIQQGDREQSLSETDLTTTSMSVIVSVEQSAHCVCVCKCYIGCKRIEDCAIIRIDPLYIQPIDSRTKASLIQLHARRWFQFRCILWWW